MTTLLNGSSEFTPRVEDILSHEFLTRFIVLGMNSLLWSRPQIQSVLVNTVVPVLHQRALLAWQVGVVDCRAHRPLLFFLPSGLHSTFQHFEGYIAGSFQLSTSLTSLSSH